MLECPQSSDLSMSTFSEAELLRGVSAAPGPRPALTDPDDVVRSTAVQTAYVEALRRAGVPVDHRFVPALDPGHRDLSVAALLAAAAAPTRIDPRRRP